MIIRELKPDDMDASFSLASKNGFEITPEHWNTWLRAITEFKSIGYVMLNDGAIVGVVIAGHDQINSHIQLFATNRDIVEAADSKRLLSEMVRRLKAQSPARTLFAAAVSEPWFTERDFELGEFGASQCGGYFYRIELGGHPTDDWPRAKAEESPPDSDSLVSLLYLLLAPLIGLIGKNRLVSFAVAFAVALVLATPFTVDFVQSIRPILGSSLGVAEGQVALPQMQQNSADDVAILERLDFIDLDANVAVPPYVLDRHQDPNTPTPKISPTVRFTRLKVEKRRPCEYFFYHAKSSSRTPPDIVCISDLDSSFQKVDWTPSRADQFLDMFQLRIDIREKATKTPFEIEWNRVGWNKFIGQDNWWTSAFVSSAIDRLELKVDFPEESGIDLSHIYLMVRGKNAQPVKLKMDDATTSFDAKRGVFTWTVTPAAQDTEYRVHWTKDITLPRF